MENFDIKTIETFKENEIDKTRLIIDEKEIILEGSGSLKIAVEA